MQLAMNIFIDKVRKFAVLMSQLQFQFESQVLNYALQTMGRDWWPLKDLNASPLTTSFEWKFKIGWRKWETKKLYFRLPR